MVQKFTDMYGLTSHDSLFEALVVLPETDDEISELNRWRTDREMDLREPIVVPYEYAGRWWLNRTMMIIYKPTKYIIFWILYIDMKAESLLILTEYYSMSCPLVISDQRPL